MAGNESKRRVGRKAISSWHPRHAGAGLAIGKTSKQAPASRRSGTKKRRNKIAAWRRVGRRAYRIEDIRGKTLDFVEFYTSVDFHCLDVRFQDKTALTFTIDPGFTVEAEQCDWKTGNMRRLRRWARIRAASC